MAEKKIIQSEWNTLLLEGFSILDLEPFETDVFINGDSVDGEILARRIEFARRLNLKSVFGSAHPKCLVIGDRVSMNYLPALINELEGEVKIHHPNANCLGSSSYKNLARWAGPNTPDFHWDLIVFNFGLSDSEMKKADYQANLRKCIQLLQARAKKLVWIESTPVPYGFNDANLKSGQFIPEEKRFDFEFEELQPVHLKPGRMKLQNQWAAQLLEEFPQVETCRLWEVVKRDETGVFKNWWYGKTISFHRNQSGPLAVSLGNSIRSALQSFAE